MASIPHDDKVSGEHPPEQHHAAGHGAHPKNLHHHFETPLQQFESDKFGMWLFLATEILLFGGLFCAYSVYRSNHPEVFIYAHQFLDRTMGGLNTLVLIFSSFTMAWAVRAAQLGQRQLLVILLTITFLCGAGFLVIKYFEYSHKLHLGLKWGQEYAYDPSQSAHGEGGHGDGHGSAAGAVPGSGEHGDEAHAEGDAAHAEAAGDEQVDTTNAPGNTDHAEAEGEQIGNIEGSAPSDTPSEEQVVANGTGAASDHEDESTTAVPVTEPAIGHTEDEPSLSAAQGDTALPGIAADAGSEAAAASQAHGEEAAHAEGGAPAEPATEAAPAAAEPAVLNTVAAPGTLPAQVPVQEFPESLGIEPTTVPPPAQQPGGLALASQQVDTHGTESAPRNVQIFFSIYFAMTGLHGIHVVIGMIVIGIMIIMSARGKFDAEYWTPIDLTGLYWHIVDLIWIFLFPLLYLIA